MKKKIDGEKSVQIKKKRKKSKTKISKVMQIEVDTREPHIIHITDIFGSLRVRYFW